LGVASALAITSGQYDTSEPSLGERPSAWIDAAEVSRAAGGRSPRAAVEQVMHELAAFDAAGEESDDTVFSEELFESLVDWPDLG
jgi:hypothetical protein